MSVYQKDVRIKFRRNSILLSKSNLLYSRIKNLWNNRTKNWIRIIWFFVSVKDYEVDLSRRLKTAAREIGLEIFYNFFLLL